DNWDMVLMAQNWKNKQFEVKYDKKGRLNDATIGPFKTLASGQPWVPMVNISRSGVEPKSIQDNPFVRPKPTQLPKIKG
ncbi:MAG: hypothetical protein EZS28_049068, partial [Streblomastix strix]